MTITTALRVYEYFVPVQYLYLAEKNYFLYRLTLAVRTSSLRTSTSTSSSSAPPGEHPWVSIYFYEQSDSSVELELLVALPCTFRATEQQTSTTAEGVCQLFHA